MKYYGMTNKFIEKYGEEAFEKIFNTLYGDIEEGEVVFDKIIKRDTINQEAEGYIEIDGKVVYFHIEDGNIRGSVVWEYSEDPFGIEYTQTVARFVLDESKFRNANELSLARRRFNATRDRIREKENNYNYDMYATGGSHAIKLYYRNWLHDNDLRIEYEEIKIE